MSMDLPEVPEDVQQLAFRINADLDPLVIGYWLQSGHSIEDIRDALRQTLEGGKRSLRYARAILESWQREGKESKEVARHGFIKSTDGQQDNGDV